MAESSPSAAHTEGEGLQHDQSSRPRVTPTIGFENSETRLSSDPGVPPSTRTCAGPRTTSSGVEYFMIFTSLRSWHFGGAPPISGRQPPLHAERPADLPARRRASI